MPGALVGAYLAPLYQQYNLARLLAPCIYYCLGSGYVPLSHVAQALPLLPCYPASARSRCSRPRATSLAHR